MRNLLFCISLKVLFISIPAIFTYYKAHIATFIFQIFAKTIPEQHNQPAFIEDDYWIGYPGKREAQDIPLDYATELAKALWIIRHSPPPEVEFESIDARTHRFLSPLKGREIVTSRSSSPT